MPRQKKVISPRKSTESQEKGLEVNLDQREEQKSSDVTRKEQVVKNHRRSIFINEDMQGIIKK